MSGSADAPEVSATLASAAPGSTGQDPTRHTVTVTAGPSGPTSPTPVATAAAPNGPGSSTGPGSATSPTTAPPPATSAPAAATSSATNPAPAGAPAIDLSHCPGCTVIATHVGVNGTLGAALATTARGSVLLSFRPGGAVAGVINVPYGASFPVPAGGVLPCDRSGRCIVTGRQADGNAILSAFELTPDGAWRDVSGNDAFPSATPRGVATDVTGDGLLDIAVQESAGGLTTWMVLTWSGDRFTVLGCAPASDRVPPASALSPDSCLS